MDSVECVVVGAGVVGLACARALARAGREVVILEKETAFGTGISARNSEVIHAGLYYPTGSLKARLCVAGHQLLYAFCAERGIAHQRCGKLVVAAQASQSAALDGIAARAQANGVADLQRLNRAQVAALEPALDVHEALLSPATGIVDAHGLMAALLGDAQAHGAMLALASPLLAARADKGGYVLEVGCATPAQLHTRLLVNACGLDAVALGSRIGGYPAQRLPRAHYARGVYFSYRGRAPFSHLVYPVPEPGGLGVHLTLDLAGQARFGPDVEWIATPDYTLDPSRAAAFYRGIRQWWPALEDDRLQPGYAGVRPKIAGPGEGDADFRIEGPQQHGQAGLVQLFGIESPGLTSSLAIGGYVTQLLAATPG